MRGFSTCLPMATIFWNRYLSLMVTWLSNTLMGNDRAALTDMLQLLHLLLCLGARPHGLGQVDLLRCQLLAEHHIAVGQPEADGQHQRTQDEVRYQEHTVQLGAALLVAGGTEAGVIPHIGAAQAETQ